MQNMSGKFHEKILGFIGIVVTLQPLNRKQLNEERQKDESIPC